LFKEVRSRFSTQRYAGVARGSSLIDISMSGAAISADEKDRLPIGTSVSLGSTAGSVVRHFQGGMAADTNTIQAR